MLCHEFGHCVYESSTILRGRDGRAEEAATGPAAQGERGVDFLEQEDCISLYRDLWSYLHGHGQ